MTVVCYITFECMCIQAFVRVCLSARYVDVCICIDNGASFRLGV